MTFTYLTRSGDGLATDVHGHHLHIVLSSALSSGEAAGHEPKTTAFLFLLPQLFYICMYIQGYLTSY
jgi:uncharacterized MAPEG superfamily protein